MDDRNLLHLIDNTGLDPGLDELILCLEDLRLSLDVLEQKLEEKGMLPPADDKKN